MLGRWTVDHGNLRERSDSYNLTFEPRITVKDFKSQREFNYDDHANDCVCSPTAGGQTRWQVPENSSLVASNATTERWRAFHGDTKVCVDFLIALNSGQRSALPYLLLYFGNCTSPTEVEPAFEILAQTNSYYNFSLSTPDNAVFDFPPVCAAKGGCKPTPPPTPAPKLWVPSTCTPHCMNGVSLCCTDSQSKGHEAGGACYKVHNCSEVCALGPSLLTTSEPMDLSGQQLRY
jgi:hypothetical protein